MTKKEPEYPSLTLLGKTGVKPDPTSVQLEVFPSPSPHLDKVTMTSKEVMSRCPITNQPDWYTVSITYRPKSLCIESKSLKLYLQSYIERDGIFGEALSAQIATDIFEACDPVAIHVCVEQKPRGGIKIISCSEIMPDLTEEIQSAFQAAEFFGTALSGGGFPHE